MLNSKIKIFYPPLKKQLDFNICFQFYESVLVMREQLGSDVVRCVGYGHVGDGNMHLNVTTKYV